MARIRSVKPEFWSDEDLADLPRDARLLYIGLWNLSDEHCRLRGDPRYVKGQLFPYDDDLSAAGVEILLNALVVAKKVVRYRVAGKQYLYLPNLGKHQRLETDKVPSKLPSPAEADGDEPAPPPGPDADPPRPEADPAAPGTDESAPGTDLSARRANWPALDADGSALLYGSGSMEHDVPPTAGADLRRTDGPQTAQELIADWIEHCRKRPPANVINQVSKQIKTMLDERIAPGDIRRGIVRWHAKGTHPSTLPSFVNEVMNADPVRGSPARDGRHVSTQEELGDWNELANRQVT